MLGWKRNVEQVLDRLRRFFCRQMQDSILATLPVEEDEKTKDAWAVFEKKWRQYGEGEDRPFPSNEEIFERSLIGMEQRGRVEDDELPVIYSIRDGSSAVGGMFGQTMRFIHCPHGSAVNWAEPLLPDYSRLSGLSFSLDNEWTRRFLSIQEYFETHANGRFAQCPCITIDALNFVVEMRGTTQAYLDLNEEREAVQALMEIGLDFNIRFQEAQMARIRNQAGGSFNRLGRWVPFSRAVYLSVDAYVISSPAHYAEFGFEYNRRLIEHFGHGLMHFHCNRADLAAEVARLPGLELFQFGGDPKDPVMEVDRMPEIRRAVGDIPIMTFCDLDVFRSRLATRQLLPNVWYQVTAKSDQQRLTIDAANRLMEAIRAYQPGKTAKA